MLARAFVFGAFTIACCSAAVSQSSSSYSASQSSSSHAASYSSSSTAPYNSVQAQTTVNIPVGPFVENDHFAASVVSADACTTTYALACTSGIFEISDVTALCDPEFSFLATYGPDSYKTLAQGSFGAWSGSALLECSLDATVSAACTVSASYILNGYQSASATSFTLVGASELGYQQVAVTAGAAMLSPSGACTTSSVGAAAPTAVIEVYKVLVVPGIVGILGALV